MTSVPEVRSVPARSPRATPRGSWLTEKEATHNLHCSLVVSPLVSAPVGLGTDVVAPTGSFVHIGDTEDDLSELNDGLNTVVRRR